MIGSGKAFQDEAIQKIKLDEKLLKPILFRRLLEEGIINSATYVNAIREKRHEE